MNSINIQHYFCFSTATHKEVWIFVHGAWKLDMKETAPRNNSSVPGSKKNFSNIWSHSFPLQETEDENL